MSVFEGFASGRTDLLSDLPGDPVIKIDLFQPTTPSFLHTYMGWQRLYTGPHFGGTLCFDFNLFSTMVMFIALFIDLNVFFPPHSWMVCISSSKNPGW